MDGGNGQSIDDDLSSSSDGSNVTTNADGTDTDTSWSGSSSNSSADSTDESKDESSSSSLTSSASSSLVDSAPLDDNNDDKNAYSSSVRDWTEKVPIGMNLCPWAKLSQKKGRIKYVTCHEEIQTPQEASTIIWNEIEKLLGNSQRSNRSLPPWSTTLVICPHVKVWKSDFKAFEAFVKTFGNKGNESEQQPPTPPQAGIALVPFHPHFLRWRGLPETISAGSTVRCHRGLAGFSKSPEAHPATVLDLRPPGFGRRRVRIRFHDTPKGELEPDPKREMGNTEQCVPVEWVVLLDGCGTDDLNKNKNYHRPPLPDNAMHRTPCPVVHILRNEDLEGLSIHEISQLKRRNAKRMASETLV
jgi:hypothetical protein